MSPNTVERIEFKNGWSVSVINGMGTYSDHGTFEVAVINPMGEVREPEGWASPKRVEEIKEEVKGY
tara:strand:+ start:657 stop:854 length:198 start_codon:yes stop_codon:yes gene_type:complete